MNPPNGNGRLNGNGNGEHVAAVSLDELAGWSTERADPRYADLDTADVGELARLMNEADAAVPAAVRAALPQIVPAIEAVVARLRSGGRLRYVGAGTAGRLGVLDASEVPPTFGTDPELVAGLLAGGREAITTAREGVEDDEDAGRGAIAAEHIGPRDAVVGVAASGRTPFVLAACAEARARGALTVGLTGNAGAALSAVVEHPIEVVVGGEVLAGSSRLKAGTAQKLVLNMISTITMVQLGHTHGGLMVDVRPTNAKLRARAVGMVVALTGADRDAAQDALVTADMRVKHAVLALERGWDATEATARLAAAGGRLRVALADAAPGASPPPPLASPSPPREDQG